MPKLAMGFNPDGTGCMVVLQQKGILILWVDIDYYGVFPDSLSANQWIERELSENGGPMMSHRYTVKEIYQASESN
jgi:hypothetical protein